VASSAVTRPYHRNPPLDLDRIDEVLATLPASFRNADFRQAMGIDAFPASEMLVRLMQAGRVHHPDGNTKIWAATPKPGEDA